jgi:YqaJ-like viral recombinase domain
VVAMMTTIDCVQGDPTWLQARIGRCTGSRVADAIAELKRKDGESAARRNYRIELIVERLTGQAAEHFVSQPMIEGIEKEPLAKLAYELEHNVSLQDVGFVTHPIISMFGCSPDAMVNGDGLVEIKCPLPHTHISYLMAGEIPPVYEYQMLAELSCCPERQWNDFVSYCPAFPKDFRLFVKRMKRDEAKIAEMEAKVQKFLDEVDIEMGKLALIGCTDLTPILTQSLNEVANYSGLVP